jgi:SWI/SNF-related matrix-associated actin-dependent regulator of chromatin subfamily A member 5
MQRFWYKRLLTRLDKGLLEGVFQNSKEKAEGDVKEEEGLKGEHIVKDEELGALDDLEEDEWGVTKKIVEQAVEESSSADGKWRKLMNLLMQLRKVSLTLSRHRATLSHICIVL